MRAAGSILCKAGAKDVQSAKTMYRKAEKQENTGRNIQINQKIRINTQIGRGKSAVFLRIITLVFNIRFDSFEMFDNLEALCYI